MKHKIAVITTEFFQSFFKEVFIEIGIGCEISMHIYYAFDEISEIYRKLPIDTDGILTSGSFPTYVLKKSVPDIKIPVQSINSDDSAIYRMFFQLIEKNRALDISRIYVDPLEMFGLDVMSYLLEDQKISYSNIIDPIVAKMELDELYKIEEKQFEKHMHLWKSGKTDISVTRFSSIVPKLKAEGVEVYLPEPSIQYVKTASLSLLKEVEMIKLKKHQPAAINICVKRMQTQEIPNTSFERQCILLQEALLDFNGNSVLDYVLKRYHFGFEILIEREKAEEHTGGYKECHLKRYLEDRLPFSVCIGYGIGNDMYQARMNAMNANRESTLYEESPSFLIDDNDTLVGPLNSKNIANSADDLGISLKRIVKDVKLSPLTIRKVVSAINSIPNRQITAGELSIKLGITRRSANRFLNELEKSNVLLISGKKRSTTKGRPERVYAIHEE